MLFESRFEQWEMSEVERHVMRGTGEEGLVVRERVNPV